MGKISPLAAPILRPSGLEGRPETAPAPLCALLVKTLYLEEKERSIRWRIRQKSR